MGLIAGSDKITSAPPNTAPEWTATPVPQFTADTSANFDLLSVCFDADGDSLTFTLGATSTALPTGISISGSNLVATVSTTAGVTDGVVIVADDGTVVTSSPPFSIYVYLVSSGDILWTGTVESGSFEEWHYNSDTNFVQFQNVHDYGMPPDYSNANHTQTESGNGELLDIVSKTGSGGFDTGPARVGDKAIRMQVKCSADAVSTGSPFHPIFTSTRIDKFDPASGNPPTDQTRQRVDLTVSKHTIDTDLAVAVIPNGAERWQSLSLYLESNFPVVAQDQEFMSLWGLKGAASVGSTAYSAPIRGWVAIQIKDSGWSIRDAWMADGQADNSDFWYQIDYGASGANYSGADVHYPNASASAALMGNLNRGGWTDFIFHWKTDTTDYADQEANNTGYIDVYMRQQDPVTEIDGNWTQILAIRPMNNVTYGGSANSYNKGIGITGAYYTNQGVGIYNSIQRVWQANDSAVMYVDNLKVGDENCSFQQMTPDNSNPP